MSYRANRETRKTWTKAIQSVATAWTVKSSVLIVGMTAVTPVFSCLDWDKSLR